MAQTDKRIMSNNPGKIRQKLALMVTEAEKIRNSYYSKIERLNAKGLLELLELKDNFSLNNEGVIMYCNLIYAADSTLDVAKQLNDYVSHIDKYFNDYKDCYEKQYEQKRDLGLIIGPKYKSIEIVHPVKGLIAVVGYSGIAKDQIAQLKSNYSGLRVKSFVYLL